jgi:hypothetical protein
MARAQRMSRDWSGLLEGYLGRPVTVDDIKEHGEQALKDSAPFLPRDVVVRMRQSLRRRQRRHA